MKVVNYLTIVLVVIVSFGGVIRAESESADKPGYIGIRMDARPLPELLTKHLRLEEGQGVRKQNVGVGTPADKAGLERDDIIVALNGKPVTDNEEFAQTVQGVGAGNEISLEIIHLGERKSVTLKLASFDEDSEFEAKFPPEPEIVQSWQPGRMFQLQPDAQSWVQIGPEGDMMGGAGGFGFGGGQDMVGSNVNRFFKEVYSYHYSTDGKEYTITIEGAPDDEDTEITVDAGDSHFIKPLKDVDKLPKEYREAAEEALKDARKTAAGRYNRMLHDRPVLPSVPDVKIWRDLQPRRDVQGRLRAPNLETRDNMLERIEEQMRQLQERIEQLEKERSKNSSQEDNRGAEKGLDEQDTGDSDVREGEKI